MVKIHMKDALGGPACMVVTTGKQYRLTNDPKLVSCKKCQTTVDYSRAQYVDGPFDAEGKYTH